MGKQDLLYKIETEYSDFLYEQPNSVDLHTMEKKQELTVYAELYGYLVKSNLEQMSNEQMETLDKIGERPLAYLYQQFLRKSVEYEETGTDIKSRVDALLSDWVNAFTLAKEGESDSIKAFVRYRVENEYEDFKRAISRCSSEDILDRLDKVRFYSLMKEYLCTNEELSDAQYRALFQESRDVLSSLYEECEEMGNVKIGSTMRLRNIVEDYNDKYYPEVFENKDVVLSR